MSTALAAAAILALATGCGGVPSGDLADRVTAIALRESGGDPLAIGVNPDRRRGLPQYAIHPDSATEAAQTARALLASGRTIGLGLMQIDSTQLVRHGLSIETALDQCRNIRAGIEHYSADANAAVIYLLASKRYNTGSFERGDAYARGVEAAVERVRQATSAELPPPLPPIVSSVVPVTSAPLPARPPYWDVYALARAGQPRPAPSAQPAPVQLSQR